MAQKGLLIDYEWCTGCHSCEMACKAEHGYEKGQWGIELRQIGPREIEKDVWEYSFIPIPTDLCDLCEERVSEGRLPTCVHHCQAVCMQFGDVEELAKKMTKSKMALYTPKA